MALYVPDTGHIVWLSFGPRTGHEQAGHRPALVLSPERYNSARGMMVCCPMTSRIRGYVFEVVVSRLPPSVVLADRIKSVDWRARGAALEAEAAPDIVAEVRAKIRTLLTLRGGPSQTQKGAASTVVSPPRSPL